MHVTAASCLWANFLSLILFNLSLKFEIFVIQPPNSPTNIWSLVLFVFYNLFNVINFFLLLFLFLTNIITKSNKTKLNSYIYYLSILTQETGWGKKSPNKLIWWRSVLPVLGSEVVIIPYSIYIYIYIFFFFFFFFFF